MPTEYTALVAALKALTQGETPNVKTLPMAESEWNTRPEGDSYGTVTLDFETQALYANNRKVLTAYNGAVDLFSKKRDGDGWVPGITGVLTEYCDSAWSLNSHQYERETGLFHWEWTFDIGEG